MLFTSLLTAAGMILITVFILLESIAVYKDQTVERVRQETLAQGTIFQDKLNPVAIKANSMAKLVIPAIENPVRDNRENLDRYLHAFFLDNGDLLAFNQWFFLIPGYIDEYEYLGENDAYERWFRHGYRSWEGAEISMDTRGLDYDPFEYDSWFNDPFDSRKMVITEPYHWDYGGTIGNRFVSSICAPILYNGNSLGVVGYEVELGIYQQEVSQIQPFPGSFAYLNTGVGTVIAYKDEFIGGSLVEAIPAFAEKEQSFSEIVEIDGYWHIASPMKIKFIDDPWILTIAIPEKVVMAPFYRMVYLVVGIVVFVLLVTGFLIFYLSRSLAKPIGEIAQQADLLAKGNLTGTISFAQRKDEIGLTGSSLRDMIDKLVEIINAIQKTTGLVHSSSREIANFAGQLSSGSSEQAAASEEVSASMEQMAASIQNNSDNATQTLVMAEKNYSDVDEGGQAVKQTVEAMDQIASKISIIDEISRQTNLLALNAAIEAARAGESGKGFAVVANEVRKLAERSQEAASEISELSRSSMDVAAKAGNMLDKVVPDIRQTTELIQEIASSSREQNEGTQQINQALLQLDQTIQANTASAEELDGVSRELEKLADELLDQVSFFNTHRGNELLLEDR